MEPITILLGAMCCLGFLLVLVALVGVVIWRLQRSSRSPVEAISAPPTPGAQPAVAESTASATAATERPVGASADSDAGAGLGDAAPDGVDDFDEDGPTILMDSRSLEMSALLGSTPPTAADQEQVQTERIFAPSPPASDEPSDPGAVASVDGPPPLPASHATDAPPSARQLLHDAPAASDPGTLEPGATIIPPDDWNEDCDEDDEVDKTMLMARPPLPPEE